ncbi:hypothetical protein O1L55_14530 [Streptomyces albulus]|nr:hypothetical protein [Streptomyces noursei]
MRVARTRTSARPWPPPPGGAARHGGDRARPLRGTVLVEGEVELVAVDGPGSVVVHRPRGTVLDAAGTVRVSGLVLSGRDADVVNCRAGTLVLERVEVRAPAVSACTRGRTPP